MSETDKLKEQKKCQMARVISMATSLHYAVEDCKYSLKSGPVAH